MAGGDTIAGPRAAARRSRAMPKTARSVYDFSALSITGERADLSTQRGKVMLIVNTASACGFTPQYEGLEKLHQRYGREGLRVVALPANDFGAQERGSNKQIAEFCQVNYGVTFTVGEKLTTPIRQDPLYAQLVRVSGKAPKWNFHNEVVDRALSA